MNRYTSFSCLVVASFILSVCGLINRAFAEPTGEEWIDIPVVINIIDASDSSNVEEAIKKANEVFKQAKIRLVPKKTNNGVVVGNGDGSLTEAEGGDAQDDGEQELSDTIKGGKGIKLTVADDVWSEKPNTVGWAVHRNPVVFVEPDSDPNELGHTIAHEMTHALTVDYDIYDPNFIDRLMYGYTGSGTTLDPNEIIEIRKEARKRGTAYVVKPDYPTSGIIPSGVEYSLNTFGGVLDPKEDVLVEFGTLPPPQFPFSDLREITVFCPDPGQPGAQLLVEVQFEGPFVVDSFFDVVYQLGMDVDTNADFNPDFQVMIQIQSLQLTGISPVQVDVHDLNEGNVMTIPDAVLHDNLKYDGLPGPPILATSSLEIPIPLGFFDPGSDPFIPPPPWEWNVFAYTQIIDPGLGPQAAFIDDAQLQSGLDLSVGCCDSTLRFACPQCPPPPVLNPDGGLPLPPPLPPLLPDGLNSPGLVGILGCGFSPSGPVEVQVAGQPVQLVTPEPDGKVQAWVDMTPYEGIVPVIMREVNDSGPAGAHHAIGYFRNTAVINSGDLDGDGDSDLVDFSMINFPGNIIINWIIIIISSCKKIKVRINYSSRV